MVASSLNPMNIIAKAYFSSWNNAEYALYTHSAIAELTKTAPYFEDLTVNFSKATKSGEKLIWRAQVNEDRTFAVIASDESGTERFQAAGTLAL